VLAAISKPIFFPGLREVVGPLSERQERFVMVLDLVRGRSMTPHWHGLPGRPPAERAALARAFGRQGGLRRSDDQPIGRVLKVDKTLRRLCGWERAQAVPSEATFSRAFAEFAASALPTRLHETVIATSHKKLWGRRRGRGILHRRHS